MDVFGLVCPQQCGPIPPPAFAALIYARIGTGSREWRITVASDPVCLHYGQALALQFGSTMQVDYNWDGRHLAEQQGFWVQGRLCTGQWTGRETEEEYALRASDRLDEVGDCSELGRLVVVTREVMAATAREELALACLQYCDRLEVVFSMKPEEFPYDSSQQIVLISAVSSPQEAESLATFILHQSCIQSQAWTTVISPHPLTDPLAQAIAHSLGLDLRPMAALKPWEEDTESESEFEARLQRCISELHGTEILTVHSSISLKLANRSTGLSLISSSEKWEVVEYVDLSVPSMTLVCATEAPVSVIAALIREKLPKGTSFPCEIRTCGTPSCISLAQSIASQYGLNYIVDYLWDDQHMTESPEPVQLEGIQYPTKWFGRENFDQFQGRLAAVQAFSALPLLVCVGKQVFSALTGTPHCVATLRQFSASDWNVTTEVTLEEREMAQAEYYADLIVQQVTTALNSAISSSDCREICGKVEKILVKEISMLFTKLETKYDAAILEVNRVLQAEIAELRAELERRNEEIAKIITGLKENLNYSLENISKFNTSSLRDNSEHWEGNLQSLESQYETLTEQFQRFYSLIPSSQLPLTIEAVDEHWQITTHNRHSYRIEDAELWAESAGNGAEKLLEGVCLHPGLSTHTLPMLSSSHPCLQLVWKQLSAPLSPFLSLQLLPCKS